MRDAISRAFNAAMLSRSGPFFILDREDHTIAGLINRYKFAINKTAHGGDLVKHGLLVSYHRDNIILFQSLEFSDDRQNGR
jgi:hypothetical protein